MDSTATSDAVSRDARTTPCNVESIKAPTAPDNINELRVSHASIGPRDQTYHGHHLDMQLDIEKGPDP